MLSLIEIGQNVLDKNFVNVFLLFRYYLPLEKGLALHLKKKNEFPSLKDALCLVLLILANWSNLEKILKFRQCIFTI